MKISELELILKEHRDNYGDIPISFGRADDEIGSYCHCEVEIEMDARYTELNITVI